MTSSDDQQIEYTVIAGELKGRRIVVPDPGVTRPPLARNRRAIFDYLNPYLEGARYLDLFSGTGSYLFEAVSRRAAEVVGVELEEDLADAINDYARQFSVADRLTCLCSDVFKALPELAMLKRAFDIVMIAPPQYGGLIEKTLGALRKLPSLLAPECQILCQHDTSERIDTGDFQVIHARKYGNTTYTVVTP
jgi:16S rRNA (guanine966-N2)-methyltransferase